MDPFSITIGAIGIADIAITRIVDLHTLVGRLADAREDLQDISSGLEAIQAPLRSLEACHIPDDAIATAAKADLEEAGVAQAVTRCADACEAFRKSLQKWTRHSTENQMSLRDRLSVGVWNQEKIKTFRTQVQSCQALVHFAVTSAQL
jgi:hypothetical protein